MFRVASRGAPGTMSRDKLCSALAVNARASCTITEGCLVVGENSPTRSQLNATRDPASTKAP